MPPHVYRSLVCLGGNAVFGVFLRSSPLSLLLRQTTVSFVGSIITRPWPPQMYCNKSPTIKTILRFILSLPATPKKQEHISDAVISDWMDDPDSEIGGSWEVFLFFFFIFRF